MDDITIIADKTKEDWYIVLVEECKAIITEAVFTSRWALVEGYHQLGERIVTENNLDRKEIYGKKILTDLSKSLNTSERNLYRAIQFYEKYPDLSQVPEGKNISWNKIITKYLPDKTRDNLVNLGRGAIKSNDHFRLIHGNISDNLGLQPECADVIITDPPYPAEFLSLYSDLSLFGNTVLKPGGLAIVMTGQSYLPDVIKRLGEHLIYHWTAAYLTPGGQAVQMWQRKAITFWKPLLLFSKGQYAGDWFGDVCKSAVNDNDKKYHDWGQSESGMNDIIERFTKPGQTIIDPFCGGGTTGVVAVNMGRNFIGIDKDESAINITAGRLRNVT